MCKGAGCKEKAGWRCTQNCPIVHKSCSVGNLRPGVPRKKQIVPNTGLCFFLLNIKIFFILIQLQVYLKPATIFSHCLQPALWVQIMHVRLLHQWSLLILCILADIDECARDSSVCGAGACENMDGSFACECSQGYTGLNCETGMYAPHCLILHTHILFCRFTRYDARLAFALFYSFECIRVC